jgi:hypothetical protein
MQISIGQGESKTDFRATEAPSIQELAEIACASNISTGTYRNNYRTIENFIQTECFAMDVDNDAKHKHTPDMTIEEAKRMFAPFKHIILTTKSHRKPKHGIVKDRFRVILFLDTPIRLPEDYYATWFWLKSRFPAIDIQCKDPARIWYKHEEVASLKEEGKLLTPIRFTEPEEPIKEGRLALPGERGELSKETLKFLEFGALEGGRNQTTFKAAKDFQQALYAHEEASERILSALHRNSVIAGDFTEGEAKIAIRSAYSKDAKYAPRLDEREERAFEYIRIGDLIDLKEESQDWLVDNLLLRGGISIMVGLPKAGKTTIVRQLEKSIIRGEPFLGRKVQRGLVIHYSFDEKARTAKKHYLALGLTREDLLALHFGHSRRSDYFGHLEEDILSMKPGLVVVDTMVDLLKFKNLNDYGEVKPIMSQFSSLAERTETHILFIHHQNKPQNAQSGNGYQRTGNSILGSTAIFGSVDCCMIFEEVPGDKALRTMRAEGRAIEGFGATKLRYDYRTQSYSLDIPRVDEDNF